MWSVIFRKRYQNEAFLGRVEALGWGSTSFGGSPSTKLRKVFLDVVNLEQCKNAYPDSVITTGQVCTYTPEKDTCSYDSGKISFTISAFSKIYI